MTCIYKENHEKALLHEIKQTLHKNYLFQVRITKFNVERNSSFTVSNLNNNMNLITAFESSQGFSQICPQPICINLYVYILIIFR